MASTASGASVASVECALNDCARLAVTALRLAANGSPVECGRVLRMLEVQSFPHAELSSRAYLLSVYLESFALARWSRSYAVRKSFSVHSLQTKRSARAASL